MLLDAGRISFKGKPADILGDHLNHVTVLPITVAIAIAATALVLPHSDHLIESSPLRQNFMDWLSSQRTSLSRIQPLPRHVGRLRPTARIGSPNEV
jgi:hypothetical protein